MALNDKLEKCVSTRILGPGGPIPLKLLLSLLFAIENSISQGRGVINGSSVSHQLNNSLFSPQLS
jgi:hypothetical protein